MNQGTLSETNAIWEQARHPSNLVTPLAQLPPADRSETRLLIRYFERQDWSRGGTGEPTLASSEDACCQKRRLGSLRFSARKIAGNTFITGESDRHSLRAGPGPFSLHTNAVQGAGLHPLLAANSVPQTLLAGGFLRRSKTFNFGEFYLMALSTKNIAYFTFCGHCHLRALNGTTARNSKTMGTHSPNIQASGNWRQREGATHPAQKGR